MTDLCSVVNLRRFQGDTWPLPFEVKDGNGEAVTVTGFTEATFGLFDLASPPNLITSKALGTGITLATNIITVIIDDVDTEELEGVYQFELEVVDDAGYRQTIARGQIEVVEDLI